MCMIVVEPGEKKLEFVRFEDIKYLFPEWYREGKEATWTAAAGSSAPDP